MRTLFLVLLAVAAVPFAAAGQEAASESSVARYVVPIDWSRFEAPAHEGHLALAREILLNSARYNAQWIAESFDEAPGKPYYALAPTNNEHDIRPATSAVLGLAVVLRTEAYDQEAVGMPRAELTRHVTKLIHGAAAAHYKNGGAWGNHWQSALWASQAGRAAWMLWDALSAEAREAVARMVEHEADRHLGEGFSIGYWNGEGGDSKAEENSWESTILVLAAMMMPEHPRAEQWKAVASELMISAFAREADMQRETPVLDGKSPAQWLDGYNLREDGIVINHNLTHNDYMTTISHLQMTAWAVAALAGKPVPETADFNFEVIYEALVTLEFESPPYKAPGGTMYQPGKAEQYYPEGTDWSKHRYAAFYCMDVYADVLGYDEGLPHKAAHWMKLRAERMREMQARHEDGRLYAAGEFDTYAGKEQMVLWLLSEAYLLQWLEAQDALPEEANWLAE